MTGESHEEFSPIRFDEGALLLLDQTQLPHRESWLRCETAAETAEAIRRLSVRGAPAIGVAAAYGLVLGWRAGEHRGFDDAYAVLMASRPTAVNLQWALRQGRAVLEKAQAVGSDPATSLLSWARDLHHRDVETNRRIGEYGANLFRHGDRVLTHCNAGALATAGFGTALGVIRAAHACGHLASVWVDETRPLLQGARLTTWELQRQGIPYHLVTDSSAGALMARGLVDRIVVGADRIAANGDTANKIGTYTVAVLAQRHGVPFYVAAPRSTIDPESPSGDAIPIEERAPDEVRKVFGTQVAPNDAAAFNLAFDVTPAELIHGIITEVGVLTAPYETSIARALALD